MRRGTLSGRGRAAGALLLILALLAGMAPAVAADSGRGKGDGRKGFARGEDFADLEDAPWAARFIVQGQMEGLIRGYREGGRFKFRPHQPVNRQEAVALVVRALGLEAEAQAAGTVSGAVYGLAFRDADHIQPWARGYVAVAVQRGLLDTAEPMFQPMRAASRLWTVQLLVRALGMRDEAERRAGEQLPFRDAAAIPAGAAGYVAVAIDLGLIAGFEDATFRPHQPVTRAQMAKLLEKLAEERRQQQPQQPLPPGVIRGVVAAVGAAELTVRLPNGQQVNVPVAANGYVFVDDRAATLADVHPGYAVRLFLDAEGRAVLVDARSRTAPPAPVQPRLPMGKRKLVAVVVSVTPQVVCVTAPCEGGSITVADPAGREYTFPVAPWVEVEMEDYGYATLADLRAGDRVKLTLRGDVVVTVEVKNESEEDEWAPQPGSGQGQPPAVTVGVVRGTVVSVDAETMVVAGKDGQEVTVRLDASTAVWIGDWMASAADLRPGDRVTVQVSNGVAVRIKVEKRGKPGQGRGED